MKVLLAAFALFAMQGPTPSTSGTVTTPDGVSLHYIESGTGPAILFVPGWTMPAEIFAPQLAHFGSAWHSVAMDPRAHGGSSKPTEGLDVTTRAGDIKAVIDRLQLAPVVLVGWSNGVTEVAGYVDRFGTEGLAGLVLIDGVAGGMLTPAIAEARIKGMGALLADRRAFTEQFVRGMYRRPQTESYIASIVEGSLKMPTSAAVTTGLAAAAVDHRPALKKIDKPAMLVVSQSPFMKWYEEMRDLIPGVRYEVMQGVGHALFADDAPGFNALLESFLKTPVER